MSSGLIGLDLEIMQEQAEALGRAGKKLKQAIDRFAAVETGMDATTRDALLNEIAARAWALMVQREHIGFKQECWRWVAREFDIPAEALKRLGRAHRLESR